MAAHVEVMLMNDIHDDNQFHSAYTEQSRNQLSDYWYVPQQTKFCWPHGVQLGSLLDLILKPRSALRHSNIIELIFDSVDSLWTAGSGEHHAAFRLLGSKSVVCALSFLSQKETRNESRTICARCETTQGMTASPTAPLICGARPFSTVTAIGRVF